MKIDLKAWLGLVLIAAGLTMSLHYFNNPVQRYINEKYPWSTAAKEVDVRKSIRKNLIRGLKKYKRKWRRRTINRVVNVLYTGQKKYKIHANIILGIISIESRYRVYAIGRNRRSSDWGLTQINDINWYRLSRVSHRILRKKKIYYHRTSKYDIATNIMNCYVYLNWSRSVLKKKRDFRLKRWIQSYNTGISGSVSKKRGYVIARFKYWNKFVFAMKNYRLFYTAQVL